MRFSGKGRGNGVSAGLLLATKNDQSDPPQAGINRFVIKATKPVPYRPITPLSPLLDCRARGIIISLYTNVSSITCQSDAQDYV